jgi:mono/diheme cytochrome c family protein
MRAATMAALLLALLATATSASAAAPVDGATLYRQKCAICHAPGGPGTAALARRLPAGVPVLLEERTDLPPLLVRTVVRNGLGGMQRFSRIELTDAQLETLVAWLGRPR